MDKIVSRESLLSKIQLLEETAMQTGRLQTALQESEEKFRVLAETMPTGILLYQDDRWIYANRAAEILSGYRISELLQMNFWDVVHPDDRQMIKDRGEKRQQGEATISRYECRILARDGQMKWIDLAGATTTIGGRPAGVVAVSDITRRKEMEEQLRKSEEQYRLLAETLSDVIFTADENLRITYVNSAVTRLRGYSVEEALTHTLEDILTPASLKVALAAYDEEMRIEAAASGRPDLHRILTLELEVKRKDGSTVWTEIIFKPLRDNQRKFTGVLSVVRDISDRKRVEEELRQSEGKYRRLAETLPDVIFTMDKNLRITYMSPAITRLRGLTVEESLIQGLENILTPKSLDMALKTFAEEMTIEADPAKDLHRTCTLELEQFHKDGSTLWTETVFRAIRNDREELVGLLGITRDITERKKAQSQIKVLSGMLPICGLCKKIRDDEGYWQQLENYISEHSAAEFTSGMCPDCAKKFLIKSVNGNYANGKT